MADLPMNADDGPNRRAGYKSWKKKYRKMRITFEQKMQEGEEIFRQETKAQATVKRIAEENEYGRSIPLPFLYPCLSMSS